MEALQGMGEHKPLAETLVEFNSSHHHQSRKPENVEYVVSNDKQRARVALQDQGLKDALAQKANRVERNITSSPPQIATSKNSLIA